MKLGKAKFYADENVEAPLIEYIRASGFHVTSANELGFAPRDDQFHLQEARRRRCLLLTRDRDYLNHQRFPFGNLKDTAIIIIRTDLTQRVADLHYGYMLVSLFDEIAASGNRNLYGLKIELKGPKITLHAQVRGKIRTDQVDISTPGYGKDLFQDDPETL